MSLDLTNQTYRIGVVDDLPYAMIGRDPVTGSLTLGTGLESMLMRTMRNYFNFSMILIQHRHDYGVLLPNGSWTGMIGSILADEIDMGFAGMSRTYAREQVVSFFYPHWHDRYTFVTPVPKRYISFYLLLRPFAAWVWTCIFFSFLAVIMLDVLFRRHKSVKPATVCRRYHGAQPSLFSLSFRLIVRQAHPRMLCLTNKPKKLFLIIWLFATLVISNSYGGSLFSVLTLPIYNKIDTIQKLAMACQEGRVTVLVATKTSIKNIFEKSETFPLKPIWDARKMTSEGVNSFDLVKQQSHQEGTPSKMYAFVAPLEFMRYQNLVQGPGNFYIPMKKEATFFKQLVSMPVRKDFPYVEQFNILLSRLAAAGLVIHWMEEQFSKVSTPVVHSDGESFGQDIVDPSEDHAPELSRRSSNRLTANIGGFTQLRLQHLTSVFYFYGLLMATAILMMATELVIDWRRWITKNHHRQRRLAAVDR